MSNIWRCVRCRPSAITKRPVVIVANHDKSNRPGSHWVAIYFGYDHAEYFDSFGMKPPTHFEKYLKRYTTHWIYNVHQIQSVISQYCGHHCVFFAVRKSQGKHLYDILKSYTNDTALNDFNAHRFTCRLA